jgi:hypothetical protein
MDNSNEQKFLEQYKKRIVKETLKSIYKKYKIYDANEEEVELDTIEKEILCPKIIKRCIAVVGIKQCSKNATENYDYCKAHLHKICFKKPDICNTPDIPIELQIRHVPIEEKCLKKIFIEDSFYYTNQQFIYDMDYNKVGYIHNKEYILTSDPFILETLFN